MEVSEKLRSTYEDKTPRALKTDRILHRATLNTSIASPGKTLNVTVPKLDEGVVLVGPCFQPRNRFAREQLSRQQLCAVSCREVQGEVCRWSSKNFYKFFEDLFLANIEREDMILEGIQSEDLCKIRSNAGDKKTSGVAEEIELNTRNSNTRVLCREEVKVFR